VNHHELPVLEFGGKIAQHAVDLVDLLLEGRRVPRVAMRSDLAPPPGDESPEDRGSAFVRGYRITDKVCGPDAIIFEEPLQLRDSLDVA
jgi:hypothetical protein